MTTLIASIDSGIGEALFKLLPESETTSRLGTGTYHLDLIDSPRFETTTTFDRVFYTIAADPDSGAETVLKTNVLAAFEWLDWIAQRMVDQQGQIVVLSSHRGAIGSVANDTNPFYRMSKAALNMGVAVLNQRYPHIDWLLVHPGLVATKMIAGRQDYREQPISPLRAAANIIQLAATKPKFGLYQTDGRIIGW